MGLFGSPSKSAKQGYLRDVWGVYRGCQGVSGECLGEMWRMSWGHLDDVLGASGGCLGVSVGMSGGFLGVV